MTPQMGFEEGRTTGFEIAPMRSFPEYTNMHALVCSFLKSLLVADIPKFDRTQWKAPMTGHALPVSPRVALLALRLPLAMSLCPAFAQAQGPIPDPVGPSAIVINLELVADDLVAPNYLTHADDGTDRLFVTDQDGTIWLIKNGQLQSTPYLVKNSSSIFGVLIG